MSGKGKGAKEGGGKEDKGGKDKGGKEDAKGGKGGKEDKGGKGGKEDKEGKDKKEGEEGEKKEGEEKEEKVKKVKKVREKVLTDKRARKAGFMKKFIQLLAKYPRMLIVSADNVTASHFQLLRRDLRKLDAAVVMGKNTLMRKAIYDNLEAYPAFENLLPALKGNVGFVLTTNELPVIRDFLVKNKLAAAAKVGNVAICPVVVPKGPTGLDPQKTNFLQALNIPSKINRGQIDVQTETVIVKQGDKVGSSEATLLSMLKIKPFFYGLIVQYVFENGFLMKPNVLDITPNDVVEKFINGVRNVASLSMHIHYPSVAAVPHLISNAYKNVLAVAVGTNYVFPRAEKIKALIK